MKMMSKKDIFWFDFYLRRAQSDLSYCLQEVKGKYGTHRATLLIRNMLDSIDSLTSKDKVDISFWQKFRTPPNTQKSRRLGWHEDHIVKKERKII
jgi:hypothetical protein